MSKPADFHWTTQERIRSHEAYLRGSRCLAATLNWVVAESATPTFTVDEPDVLTPDVKYPDTLVDDPKDHDAAVDHSDADDAHDTSVSFTIATNWDALLDTAGIPTDGTPPDPLAAQRQQDALEEHTARQALNLGAPASPATQKKAMLKQRAGRGVEGSNDCPSMATVGGCSSMVDGACPDACTSRTTAALPAEACGDECDGECDCDGDCNCITAASDCPSMATVGGCSSMVDGACPDPCTSRTTASSACPSMATVGGCPSMVAGACPAVCADMPSSDENPEMAGPVNPMDPGNKYDWDSFTTTPHI
jgi:hypothetical protein